MWNLVAVIKGQDDSLLPQNYCKGIMHLKHLIKFRTVRKDGNMVYTAFVLFLCSKKGTVYTHTCKRDLIESSRNSYYEKPIHEHQKYFTPKPISFNPISTSILKYLLCIMGTFVISLAVWCKWIGTRWVLENKIMKT